MNTKISLDVHNRFDAVLTNVKTGEQRHYTAYNTVLDNYFAILRSHTSLTNAGAGYLQVGTGTGTIATTDVSLFNRLLGKSLTELGVTCLSHTRFERKATVTFTETEAIGNLTEVGVATSTTDNTLVTHAFFTDGEGNPISIPKTNTDRLTVTVTIYADFTITGPVRRFSVPDGYGIRELTDTLGYKNEIGNTMTITGSYQYPPHHFAYWVTCACNGIRTSSSGRTGRPFSLCSTPYPSGLDFAVNSFWLYYTTNYADATVSGNLVRNEMYGQINSDVGNKSKTYQIKSLVMFSLFYLPFPNESIFPKKKLTFELAGDGVTSGWDLGVPMLMTDNVAVSIDGVVQSPSTYTFTGRDLTCLQGLPSAQAEFLIDTNVTQGTTGQPVVLPVGVSMINIAKELPWYFVYDFGQPITIDTVQGRRNCELYHSNDGNTWTLAAQVTASGTLTKVAFTPVSSRYWKLVITVKDTQSSNADFITPAYWGFYRDKHQIEFNTPPANGSLIEIDAYTEYPIKNDKWIIDQIVFDFTIERGSGS